MKAFHLNSLLLSMLLGLQMTAHAVEVPSIPNSTAKVPTEKDAVDDDSSDTPWSRRMDDVSGLFGVKVRGEAASTGGAINNEAAFNTFQPWQENQFEAVGAYAQTQVGFGCDGMNLGGIIDGQLAQYSTMAEEFISQAPALAVMYLAYSQPVVKAVIDELNGVGQFGLDMSALTCSGVRKLADKSHEEKVKAEAEADCTATAGFSDASCIGGEGLLASYTKQMKAGKEAVTSRATSLMGSVSTATGGYIKPTSTSAQNSTRGGGTGTGTGTGSGAGTGTGTGTGGTGNGLPAGIIGKNCAGVDVNAGTTPMILGASEMSCKDIKKYSGLLPSFVNTDKSQEVIPRSISIEELSKEITTEHMELLTSIYESDYKTFTSTDAFKNMVNRAEIVVSKPELLLMQELAKKNPARAIQAQRQMATLSMMKELEIIISKIEIGVQSGVSNQVDQEYVSQRVIGQYDASLSVIRQEFNLLKAKIEADQARSKALNDILVSAGG